MNNSDFVLYDIRNELFANPAWIRMNPLQMQFFSWKSSNTEIEALEYPISILAEKCLPNLNNSEKEVEYTSTGYRIHIKKEGFDFYLGSDILTSAGIPLRNFLNRKVNGDDESNDLNKEEWIVKAPSIELSPSQEAFLCVVYTIGNMMLGYNRPPGGGKSLRRKSGDVAFNKLIDIENVFNKKYGKGSFQSLYTNIGGYINCQFLSDFYTKSMEPKLINHLLDIEEFSDDWCSITSKLIIQRGYRIHKGFTEKWNMDYASEVCEAFKAVGLPQDPDEAHGPPYTIIGEWEE